MITLISTVITEYFNQGLKCLNGEVVFISGIWHCRPRRQKNSITKDAKICYFFNRLRTF